MAKEKEEEVNKRFELTEVPTQTGVFVKDNMSEAILDDKAVLVQILNDIQDIKKVVG